jgi:UDP-N-acetylglucosamine--N-acetylmuramyl-(pentapeptide) pyrophosphoryl-undecaprenol N-acetylglucosamine transferase
MPESAKVSGLAPVLVAAGGTGGHLFPAEALAAALNRRGIPVHLVTDHRATRFDSSFADGLVHVVSSATVSGRSLFSLTKTLAALGVGYLQSRRLIARLKPAAVIGFGGYPTLPPVLAAAWSGVPSLIHDSNAVIGRANNFLAPRVRAIATTFPDVFSKRPALAAKATLTGNPVRPAVVAAAATPYPPISDPLQLLIFGGSQGARVMADVVPAAISLLDPALRARLSIVQQARDEDLKRARDAYDRISVKVELAPFFSDLPARMAASHLIVSRSGASTVSELSAIGRPSILVPLPGAIDQDQFANAGVLELAGGAIRLVQDVFTPRRLAAELTALAGAPQSLVKMAESAKSVGRLDAADRLADLVLKVAADAANH